VFPLGVYPLYYLPYVSTQVHPHRGPHPDPPGISAGARRPVLATPKPVAAAGAPPQRGEGKDKRKSMVWMEFHMTDIYGLDMV